MQQLKKIHETADLRESEKISVNGYAVLHTSKPKKVNAPAILFTSQPEKVSPPAILGGGYQTLGVNVVGGNEVSVGFNF